MTLGQFSTAVGASRKWVQNAFTVLALSPGYTEARARKLALARMLTDSLGISLKRAWTLAGNVLTHPRDPAAWRCVSPSGSHELLLDAARFESWFTGALSRARVWYVEKQRGRPSTRRRRRGVALARQRGIDIGLLEAALRRSPAERLRRLDEDVTFLKSMRIVGR